MILIELGARVSDLFTRSVTKAKASSALRKAFAEGPVFHVNAAVRCSVLFLLMNQISASSTW